jgi:hypothetical protein
LIFFRADAYVAAGFLITAVCPGAFLRPPFTAMAKGNVVVSVGLMVILVGVVRAGCPAARLGSGRAALGPRANDCIGLTCLDRVTRGARCFV